MALGERHERSDLVPPDEVVGEVDEVDGDPRREERLLHLVFARRQLGPGHVERLDGGQAARAKHAAVERASADRQVRQQALGIGTGQRRDRLLAQ